MNFIGLEKLENVNSAFESSNFDNLKSKHVIAMQKPNEGMNKSRSATTPGIGCIKLEQAIMETRYHNIEKANNFHLLTVKQARMNKKR